MDGIDQYYYLVFVVSCLQGFDDGGGGDSVLQTILS